MKLTSTNNNKPYTISNPRQCGFPLVGYYKNRDVILSNDYTIVRIEQYKEGTKTMRRVDEILSPATVIEDVSAPITNSIVSIYIEVQKEEPKF